MPKETQTESKEWKVGSVPTETRTVLVSPDGEAIDEMTALALILNKLDKIAKGTVG